MSANDADFHGHFGIPDGYDHLEIILLSNIQEDPSSVGNDDSCEPYDPNCGGGFV